MEATTAPASDVSTESKTTEVKVNSKEPAQPAVNPDQAKFMEMLKNHKEKIKVYDREEEVDYETMKKGYQLAKASNQRMHEASMKEKRAMEFINQLRTNPKQVLLNPNLGIDMRTLAEEILVENMKMEMMDPKDRELMTLKQQLEASEQEKKLRAQQEQESQFEQLREKYSTDFSNVIVQALQEQGLPKTEHAVRKMAYYMHQAVSKGYDIPPNQLADLVRQDYINEQKALYAALDEDVLAKMLGEDTIKKIRKYEAKRLKSKGLPTTPKRQPQVQVLRKPKGGRMSFSDWKKQNIK